MFLLDNLMMERGFGIRSVPQRRHSAQQKRGDGAIRLNGARRHEDAKGKQPRRCANCF